jgi:hypothetical protein
MNADEFSQKATELADAIAREQEADVLLFNAPIQWTFGKGSFADRCHLTRRRKNVLLILVTNGGDPDAAYRMARCLQRTYKDGRITALIPSLCKSAGTLVAVGAHEIVMTDQGELGPLDVQLRKADELLERMSGLDVYEALTSLQQKAFEAFEDYLLGLNFRSQGGISLKTALQAATDLTVGLFDPIYGQIDPMRMGEIAREIRIADEYGKRLNSVAKNLKAEALDRLVAKYPSHTFVIDHKEAKELFNNVREATRGEGMLIAHLDSLVREPLEKAAIGFLSTALPEESNDPNTADSERTVPQAETAHQNENGGTNTGDCIAGSDDQAPTSTDPQTGV